MEESHVRLDRLLVQRGLIASRNRAQRAIDAGEVWVDGEVETRASRRVSQDADICVAATDPFVGRGAHKLEKALEAFSLSVQGRTVLDVGASTGGFTQRLLAAGAMRVYALDVGSGQLAECLRKDERVVNMEQTHIKSVSREDFSRPLTMATVDVSFLSLTHVLPVLRTVLEEGSPIILLIKPQFEAGPNAVGKRGIVRDASVHRSVIHRVMSTANDLGFVWVGLDYSPVLEMKANLEFLVHLYTPPLPEGLQAIPLEHWDLIIEQTVDRAHRMRHT